MVWQTILPMTAKTCSNSMIPTASALLAVTGFYLAMAIVSLAIGLPLYGLPTTTGILSLGFTILSFAAYFYLSLLGVDMKLCPIQLVIFIFFTIGMTGLFLAMIYSCVIVVHALCTRRSGMKALIYAEERQPLI